MTYVIQLSKPGTPPAVCSHAQAIPSRACFTGMAGYVTSDVLYYIIRPPIEPGNTTPGRTRRCEACQAREDTVLTEAQSS